EADADATPGRGPAPDGPPTSGEESTPGTPRTEAAQSADARTAAPEHGADGSPVNGPTGGGRPDAGPTPGTAPLRTTVDADADATPGRGPAPDGPPTSGDGGPSRPSAAHPDRPSSEESTPGTPRTEAAQPADARTAAPEQTTGAQPTRVDPRIAHSDPAAPAPHLTTAGVATAPAPTGADHRSAPQPNEHQATPGAATGTPGATPYAGTPGGTPGGSPSPGIPGQRRTAPETPAGPPTTAPRPTADRGPGLRPDPRAAFSTYRAPAPPDGHSPRTDAHRPTAPAPTPGPDTRRPPASDSAASRPEAHRPPDASRPEPARPAEHPDGHNSRPEQANTADHTRPGEPTPYRPASADRPQGSPGGLLEPDAQDHERVRDAVPHHPDGTPQRHPDPNDGDWPGAINGHDPNAPGRTNNCVDVALATVDTYSGHPTPAAARTPDHDADGNPSPHGERGGRDRIENALGARFSDLGNGPDAYRRLEDTLRKNGHGSQAVIITTDRDGRSHAWNAVNHQGRITYIDAQTGRRSDQPLHDGSNGVFAVPLDPNRRPAAPAPSPETDPARIHENERRAPERPAGADDTSTDPPPDGRYNDDAERQRVRAQVAKANTDPDWFKKHYNISGHRKAIGMKDENGNEIPQLRQNPEWSEGNTEHDRWMAAQDAPPPAAEDYHYDREVLREAAVPADRERTRKIEAAIAKRERDLAADRVAEDDLAAAKAAHEADKTDEDAKQEYERLKEAHKGPHYRMGKSGEELGDQVAEFHAVPENFPDAIRVDDRKDGNNRFDQIWERPDGSFVVVEAKAPTAKLGDRRAVDGRQVMQGHPDYFTAILEEMAKRGEKNAAELRLMKRLMRAQKAKKVDYVLVQARVDNDGQYDGYRMKHFNIDGSAQEGSP
ncbi:toxin glutamine deamidase domain-containing protein, partial [Kitasatospora sp. NPDC004531]